MWADPVQREQVFEALATAKGGPVEEGSIGAGTGTQAFGWKGGIGTSSRVLSVGKVASVPVREYYLSHLVVLQSVSLCKLTMVGR